MATAAKFDADFSDFVSELNKVEVKLKEFEPNVKKSSDAARKFADSMNGNRVAEQAQIAVRGLQLIDGGVERLTKGELRRLSPLIDEAVEKFGKMGRAVPADMAAVKASIDATKTSTEQLATSGSSMSSLFKQGLGIGAGMTAVGVAQQGLQLLATQLGDVWEQGQKMSALRPAFEALSGGPAEAATKLEKLRTATRGLVTDLDLMQAANKASLLGLDAMGIKTDEMASVAVKLGKAMGQDAAKSVDDLTTALARQSPMILDNLGIKVSLTDAYEAFARQQHKTVEALTDEEKKLAFASAAMESAKTKVAALGEQHLTMGEQVTRVSVAFDNVKAAAGAAANETGALADAIGKVADALDDLAKNGPKAIRAMQRAPDLALKLQQQLSPGGPMSAFGSMGPFGALVDTYLTARMPKFDPVDQLILQSMTAKGDIVAPGGPAKGAGAVTPTPEQLAEEKRLKKEREAEAKRHAAELKRLAKEHDEQLAELTGQKQLAAAAKLQANLAELATKKIALTDDAAAKAFADLWDAKTIAANVSPQLVAGINASLQSLSRHPGVIAQARNVSLKLSANLFDTEQLTKDATKSLVSALAGVNTLKIDQTLSSVLQRAVGTKGLESRLIGGKPTTVNVLADTYALKKGLEDVSIPMTVINDRWEKSITQSTTLLTKVSALSQAFSNMATIGGDKFGGIAEGMGTAIAAIDASMKTVDLLGSAFGSDTFGKSDRGKQLGAAMVGLQLGAQFGAMAGSPGKGALAGAASGAASGAAFGVTGAAIGAGFGAISGYFAGRKAQKQAREAMSDQKSQLLALYGTRENLIKQGTRLGISEEELNKNILNNTKDTKAYAATFGKLSEATAREEAEAKKLAETWGDVTRVRGLLDAKQLKELRGALAGGEGPKADAAIEFLEAQTQSLLEGIQGALDSGGLTPALVGAIGDSLPAAFGALQRSGMSAIDALKAMQPILDSFQTNAVNAGLGSAEGFDTLNAMLGTLKDEKLGPLTNAASFASQAMAALNNMGLLSAGTFDGFADTITDAYTALSESKGSEQALMLLHQPLQNLWQLTKDFGYEVDDNTRRMLEQAEAAGSVGDKFRPASERAAAALDLVVEKLDELIDVFKGDLVDGSVEGAEEAGRRIVDEFAALQPVVKVRYEYPDPPETVPAGSGGGDAARAATDQAGGDIYMDGERVGFIVGRHMGTVSDYAGA